jgi:hypothetical protein
MHADVQIGRHNLNEVKFVYAKEDKNFERMWCKKGLLL